MTETESVANNLSRCKVVSKDDYSPADFKYLKLKQITYEDPQGCSHFWESVERNRCNGGADGVAVLAVLRHGSKPDELSDKLPVSGSKAGNDLDNERVVLVAQYRPPVGKIVLELPAGLIEPGEKPEEAAIRELREETGYTGRLLNISPVFYGEPGMSNSSCHIAYVEVDVTDPANANPTSSLDAGVFLEHVTVPYDAKLLESLTTLSEKNSWVLDAKLYTLAMGLTFGSSIEKAVAAKEQGDTETVHISRTLGQHVVIQEGESSKVVEEEIVEIEGHLGSKQDRCLPRGVKGKARFGKAAKQPQFFAEDSDSDEDDDVDAEDMMEFLSALMAGGGDGFDMSENLDFLGQSLKDVVGMQGGWLNADEDENEDSGEWVTDNGEDDDEGEEAQVKHVASQDLTTVAAASIGLKGRGRGKAAKGSSKKGTIKSSLLSDPLTVSCGILLVSCVAALGVLQLRHWMRSST